MKHLINVKNIACDGCVNTIQSNLQKIEGVKSVKVENKTKVIVEGNLDKHTLVATLAHLGYPEI